MALLFVKEVSALLSAVFTCCIIVTVDSKVNSKTVAQCVEFYYTYKKQVKIGRNGTLSYGEAELSETRSTEEEVDYKVSLCVCTCSYEIHPTCIRAVGLVILSAALNRVHKDLICERKRKKTGSGRYQGTGSERAALTG